MTPARHPRKQKRPAGGQAAKRSNPKPSAWWVGLAQVAVVLLLSALVWAGIENWMAQPGHFEQLQSWSYPGIFIISLLASASILVPTFPLQVAVVALGRSLDPWLVGLVAGLGSGIGELTGYGLGQGSEKMLKASPQWAQKIVKFQTGLVRRYAGPAVFVLAAIPNPFFDIAGITAGLAGLSIWEFLLASVAGRILRFWFLAHLGIWSHGWI